MATTAAQSETGKRSRQATRDSPRKRFKSMPAGCDDRSDDGPATQDEKENLALVNDQLPTPATTPTKAKGKGKAVLTAANEDEDDQGDDLPAAQPRPNVLSPFARASAALRVSATIDGTVTLVGRQAEQDAITTFLERRLGSIATSDERSIKRSMYISGPPGIGKTAIVTDVLRAYASVQDSVCLIIENCASAGKRIWSSLSKAAGLLVECADKAAFETQLAEDGRTFIICLDEIDHLVSTCGKATLNALFHLAHRPGSNVVLIGIANALDLTFRHLDRDLLATIQCEEGDAVNPLILPFHPYDARTLSAVVQSRLRTSDADDLSLLVEPRALDLAAKKVASTSGDVRVLFAIVRHALRLAIEQQADGVSAKVSMPIMLAASKQAGLASAPNLAAKLADMALGTRCALLSVVLAVRRKELEARAKVTATVSTKRAPIKTFTAGETTKVPVAACFAVYRTIMSRTNLSGLSVAQLSNEEYLGLLDALETASFVDVSRDTKQRNGHKTSPLSTRRFKPVPSYGRARSSKATPLNTVSDDKQVRLLHDRMTLEDALEETPKDATNAVKVVVELSRSVLSDERARMAVQYASSRAGANGRDDEEAPREYSTAGLDLSKAYMGSRAME